ncbi:hypothetical protein SUGI_0463540 [Cryptomeria japonica]|nr:hypothetical protein SUGI_0463540 [Cryptomeria japonica]
MTTIFHDLMHVTVEDYVDDLLGKSVDRDTHLDILSVVFDQLEKYKVRLNPKKCVFGVTSEKLLRFIVSKRGIEADPTKHLLHKNIKFKWDDNYQQAFQILKDYLLNPPVMMPPVPDQSLLLYISATSTTLGALLAQQVAKGKEKAVYYISRTLHGAGAGILFITPQGDSIPKSYRLSFPCTNNIAKYEALITRLRITVQWKIQELRVFGDSQLVIRQETNDYQTKDEKLMPYKRMVDDLKQHFTKIDFEQIPIEHNRAVDAMATIASLIDLSPNETRYEFLVDNLLDPSYEITPTKMICIIGPESQLYGAIFTYLRDNALPPDLSNNQPRTFIRQSSQYVILVDILYRRGLDGTLLRCLEGEKA